MNIDIIPKPKSLSMYAALSRIPGLSHLEITKLLDALSRFTHMYLEEKKSWARQSEQNKKSVKFKVLETCSFLARFEDAWPIEAFVGVRVTNKFPNGISCRVCAAACTKRPRLPRGRKSHKPTIPQDVPSTSNTPRECTPPSRSSARDDTTEEDTDVSHLLHTLHPSLSQLAPSFIQGGVTNRDQMRTLAELPDAQKELFLRYDIRLNPLQTRIAQVGLARLRQEGQ